MPQMKETILLWVDWSIRGSGWCHGKIYCSGVRASAASSRLPRLGGQPVNR